MNLLSLYLITTYHHVGGKRKSYTSFYSESYPDIIVEQMRFEVTRHYKNKPIYEKLMSYEVIDRPTMSFIVGSAYCDHRSSYIYRVA